MFKVEFLQTLTVLFVEGCVSSQNDIEESLGDLVPKALN